MASTLSQSFKPLHFAAALLAFSVALQASAAHSYTDKLVAGETLQANEFLKPTDNNLVNLIMQGDGNLVLYRMSDSVPLWHTNSWGHPGAVTVMQGDGNLVVYGANGTDVLFHTNTWNNPGSYLQLLSSGNLVVKSASNTVLWASNTSVQPAPIYSTPSYQPTFWNDGATIQRNNNCYNYANNKRTDTFAQPGRAHGVSGYAMTGPAVYNAAVADGLVPTTATGTSPEGKTKIALVVAPGVDYHWYRQDADGRWTHKPGQTRATNVDNSGVTISNPETANRGMYTLFVGYFFTPSDAVQGQGKADIR
ncbi:hypothetical protein [Duganella vulcania]|uniref:Bulb-type lectin domain-containing protein n=1 Tax=Duganella vulcania TaxID=2692166 RepID=A0A845GL95_9BURK|nr:hypothetical protein [Duganella vulcania]MYM94145.1 hypothetical protein [Duganella vulcania]